jgi:HlyD family secretion protein
MKRFLFGSVLLAAVAAAGGLFWWLAHRTGESKTLTLYGNLDLRQVSLPFNNSERIKAVLVEEGDRVRSGQVLARLDTSRLEPQVAQADAQVAAQREVVDRLHNGNRPEEIALGRANVESAKADLVNARLQHQRLKSLFESSAGRAVSQRDLDAAKATWDVAEAKVVAAQKTLDLLVLGPRKEEIAEAEAKLRASEAQRAFLRQSLKDAELLAPSNAVVRSRILEPGELASPQRPVFTLAITDPKWVRAYVTETDLGKVRAGMSARIVVDSFPAKSFEGWIGFISSVAEFTPKSVQTEELRTSLVYEVRVFVKDPEDRLKLGMPATVYLSLATESEASSISPNSPEKPR